MIIPVINKIDLISARPDEVAQDLQQPAWVCPQTSILRISAKEGSTSTRCSKRLSSRFRRRRAISDAPLQALIFDSHYDSYKGVIAYIRVIEGTIRLNGYAAPDGDRC